MLSSLTDVAWEYVSFDLTTTGDMIEKRKEEGRYLHLSSIDMTIIASLSYVFYQIDEKQREKSKPAKEFLEELIKQRKKTRVSILAAHGTMVYNQWQYLDYERPVEPVQSWIDRESTQIQEKKPDILIISSCNAGRVVPVARGVSLLYPLGIVGYFQNHTYFLTP